MPAGRPRSFDSVERLEEGVAAYYKECEETTICKTVSGAPVSFPEPLSMSGLASSLGVSRDTLSEYAKGAYDDDENEFSDTIKIARAKIERDKVARAMLGIYDKTISIFDLKNNHGWKDKTEVESKNKNENFSTVEYVIREAPTD